MTFVLGAQSIYKMTSSVVSVSTFIQLFRKVCNMEGLEAVIIASRQLYRIVAPVIWFLGLIHSGTYDPPVHGISSALT